MKYSGQKEAYKIKICNLNWYGNEYAIMHSALSAVTSFIFYLIARKWDPNGVDIYFIFDECMHCIGIHKMLVFLFRTHARLMCSKINEPKKQKKKRKIKNMNVRKFSTVFEREFFMLNCWKMVNLLDNDDKLTDIPFEHMFKGFKSG